MYFHLWANAYKNDSTAFARQQLINGNTDFHFAGADEHGFIDSLSFRVNGKPVEWEYCRDSIDICRIILNEPWILLTVLLLLLPFMLRSRVLFHGLDMWVNHTRLHNGTQNLQYMTGTDGTRCLISTRVNFTVNSAPMM